MASTDSTPNAVPFTGTYTASWCGPKHEFGSTDDKTKTIAMIGTSPINPANDIVLKLYGPDDTVIASADSADQRDR